MYPKGSSLGCLKRLSLSSGILHVFASIVAVAATLLCGLLTACCFVFQDVLLSAVASLFPELLSGTVGIDVAEGTMGSEILGMGLGDVSGVAQAMFASLLTYAGIVLAVVAVVMLLFSILSIRRATTHLGRNRMLKLFPSGSGLRVYRYQLWPTILALVFTLALFVGCFFIEWNVSSFVTAAIPLLAVVLDLITWIYMVRNFDKMLEEV